jgi:hypothetical protein
MAKPLHIRHVAVTFVSTFLFFAIVLCLWYEPHVLLQDPLMAFAWAGTAYLLAYTVTECVRLPEFPSFIGLTGALLLFAFDIARHGDFIVQKHGNGLLSHPRWAQFAIGNCNVSGNQELTCRVIQSVVPAASIVLCVIAGLLLVPMIHKLFTLASPSRRVVDQ